MARDHWFVIGCVLPSFAEFSSPVGYLSEPRRLERTSRTIECVLCRVPPCVVELNEVSLAVTELERKKVQPGL